jgi:glycosyltransferase involved in cell wall biosynthesis
MINGPIKLWIWGTVPDPVGGVAVFCQRLIESKLVPIAGLIDPYFARRKDRVDVEHITPRKLGFLHRIKAILHLRKIHDQPLFINGSRPQSLLIFAPLLLCRTAATCLLLHHGDLRGAYRRLGPMQPIIARAMKRMDQILCLSTDQENFYTEIGISKTKIALVNSHISPPAAYTSPILSDQAQKALAWMKQRAGPVIIGSGSAQPFYHHDWPLDVISQQMGKDNPARYILCCYGPQTEHLELLKAACEEEANAHLCFGLRPDEFNQLLAAADIYVRPTSIDSFGIAIHDAMGMGLQVIASDVCERPYGTALHKFGDKKAFTALLLDMIDQPEQPAKMAGHKGIQSAEDRPSIANILNMFLGRAAVNSLDARFRPD